MTLAIFFLFLGLVSAAILIRNLSGYRKKDDQQWNGPRPTKRQVQKNKQAIFNHIEQFPHGALAQDHPEYVNEYLDKIELDLPEGVTASK